MITDEANATPIVHSTALPSEPRLIDETLPEKACRMIPDKGMANIKKKRAHNEYTVILVAALKLSREIIDL